MNRFHDPFAEQNEYLIHTVEISDERDPENFVTFWFKGQKQGRAWAAEHGIKEKHDPAIYHTTGKYTWMPDVFPGKESQGWSTHFHVDLREQPTFEDLERFAADLPLRLLAQIEAYFWARVAA